MNVEHDFSACTRIGLSQMYNSTNLDKNYERMVSHMHQWAEYGASLVIFPECALTGFSAQPRTLTLDVLSTYIDGMRALASELGIVAVVPSIVERVAGQPLNAGWVMGGEQPHFFVKQGLTDSERLFFHVSDDDERVFEHGLLRYALVICREVADGPSAYGEVGESDVALWPGYWRWGANDVEDATGLGKAAGQYAKDAGVPLLQANFCGNNLGDPQRRGPTGESAVFNSSGAKIHTGLSADAGESGVLVTLHKENGGVEIDSCENIHLGK